MTWTGRRVLLTGATGFVGGRLAAHLIGEGARVTALVRSPSRAGHLLDAGVELAVGDLAARDVLAVACSDVEVVIHAAALASDSGPVQAYYRANVTGTQELARAALAAGVERFVFLSTISVYGLRPPSVADETTPVGDIGGDYPYAASKVVAERALAAVRGMDVVIARVGSVYGPGSSQWTARPVRVMRTPVVGMVRVEGGRGLHNYVYVDNVVDGLLACASHPDAPGRTFNLTDGVVTYAEFFDYYAQMIAAGPPPMRDLSRGQARAIAYVAERVAAARGATPLLTRVAVDLLCRRATFPSARARDILGWNPRVSLDDGMAACERWLGDEGLLG